MGACISSNRNRNSKSFSSKSINKSNIRVVHYNGFLESFEDPITVGQVTANVSEHFLCTPAQLMLQDLKPLMPDTELKSGNIYFLLPYSTLQFEISSGDLASISKKLSNIAKSGISLSKSASANSEATYHGFPIASPTASPLRSASAKSSSGKSRNRYSNSYSSYRGASTRLEELNPTSPYRSSPLRSTSEKSPNRYSNAYATRLEEMNNPGSPYRSSPLRSSSDKSPNRYSNTYTISEGPSACLDGESPMRSYTAKSPNRYSDQYVTVGREETVNDLQMAMRSPSWKPMLATIRERSINRRTESDLQEKNVQIPV